MCMHNNGRRLGVTHSHARLDIIMLNMTKNKQTAYPTVSNTCMCQDDGAELAPSCTLHTDRHNHPPPSPPSPPPLQQTGAIMLALIE